MLSTSLFIAMISFATAIFVLFGFFFLVLLKSFGSCNYGYDYDYRVQTSFQEAAIGFEDLNLELAGEDSLNLSKESQIRKKTKKTNFLEKRQIRKGMNKIFRFSENETAFLDARVAYNEFLARTDHELELSDFCRILKRDFDCLVKRRSVNKKRAYYIRGLAIKRVPYQLKNDPEFIKKARIHGLVDRKPVPYALRNDPEFMKKVRIDFSELFIITNNQNHHVAYSVLIQLFRSLDSKFYTKRNTLLSVLREEFSLNQRSIGKRDGFCGIQLTEKATIAKMRFQNGVFVA